MVAPIAPPFSSPFPVVYDAGLEKKLQDLYTAEEEWLEFPVEKWHTIMGSSFFRLVYSWRFLCDKDALAELKKQASKDPDVSWHYQRIDY